MKWIFVLMMLEQNPMTDDIEWVEIVRIPDIFFEVCSSLVAETVAMGEEGNLRIDPWCEPDIEEEKEDK